MCFIKNNKINTGSIITAIQKKTEKPTLNAGKDVKLNTQPGIIAP